MRRSGYGIDDGVFYLLQDHLKSSSSFVNQSGATLANNYYYPYGGNRGGAFSNLTTKRFTGQYHESNLPGGEGLSYYGARWYDAKLGRFLSADTIVPGPANPQAFNRYSYGFNNPLRFVDPTGHDPCDNGSRTCDSLNGGSRPTNIYLPIVTNQRPAAGSACPGSVVCLPPTPTAFPTLAPMAPKLIPTWTPTVTPTAAPLIGPAPRPTPTSTPVSLGSVNWGGMYWAGIETFFKGIPEAVDQTAFGWGLTAEGDSLFAQARLGNRMLRSMPGIGYAVAVLPNMYKNWAYGDGFSGRNLYIDWATDSLGYGFSNTTGALGLGAGLLTVEATGPVGPAVGYVVGSFGGNYVWDTRVGPWVSTQLNSAVDVVIGK